MEKENIKQTALLGLIVILGVVVWRLANYGIDKVLAWNPSSTTPSLTFASGGDHPKNIIQLDPNGVLHLDITELYKSWEAQAKLAKATSAKPAPEAPKSK